VHWRAQYGNCESFDLCWHSSGGWPRKPMMQSYYSMSFHKDAVRYVGSCFQLPNHM